MNCFCDDICYNKNNFGGLKVLFCKNKIAEYKQPKKIIIINNLTDLENIPKGPTKKVLYRKLKQYYENNL